MASLDACPSPLPLLTQHVVMLDVQSQGLGFLAVSPATRSRQSVLLSADNMRAITIIEKSTSLQLIIDFQKNAFNIPAL